MRIDFPTLQANWLQILATLLFALFVITLPRFTDFAKTWYVLLVLLGVFCLVIDSGQLRATSTAERVFFAALVLNFTWIAATSYYNGQPGHASAFVWGRHFFMLFLIPMFFLFRKIRVSDRALLLILLCSVTISLGDILLEYIQGIDYRAVLDKRTNINGFAPIQLCLSGLLLIFFIHRSKTPFAWLAVAGCGCGIAAVILSQSRSTWLSLIVLAVLFSLYLARSVSQWRRLALMLLVLTLVSASYSLPVVKSRVDKTFASVSGYLASNDSQDDSRKTSIGIRLELWRAGWQIFLDNPLTGVGAGSFRQATNANPNRYQFNEAILQHNYVHNQYIAALATRGLPGLILLLLVLTLPVYIAMTQKSADRDEDIARLSIILVCLVYLIGNVAEDHLETKPAIMFLSIMLPFLLARINSQKPMWKNADNR